MSQDMLHGTLDALILKTLTWGPRHGYGIARWIEEATAEAVAVEEGSLYPALYRMERRGWIQAEWGTSELGRKAKFYAITADGREQLTADTEQWARFATAVSRVLIDAGQGKPFDFAQGKPLDFAQGKPLDFARGKP